MVTENRACPRPPWIENPYRLVSLGEIVKHFEAHRYVKLADVFGSMSGAKLAMGELSRQLGGKDHLGAKPLTDEFRVNLIARLTEVAEGLPELGLKASAKTVVKIIKAAADSQCTFGKVAALTEELQGRLIDELEGTLLLSVNSDRARFYVDDDLFGAEVANKFPSAAFDLEEAGKCFALDRFTASVFHLMRVAEAGLATIANRVGLTNARPGWEEAIKYIEGQVNKNYAEMDALFKGDVEFLSGIASHMRDLNLAWRRRVAHIERTYTEEEAHRIFLATKGLIEHIATKLSEVDVESAAQVPE